MGLQGPQTAEWFKRAEAALVSGVSSGFRNWGSEDTLVIDHGEGGRVFDMDGKSYVDYQCGFGPIILGHGEPAVVEAVAAAAAAGTTYAMTQAIEVEAAEAFKRAVPWVDALRFTNTGTEATMHAIRLARAYTGRELIVKYEGCYHGAHDYVLFSTAGSPVRALGSRHSPVPWQTSSGIPEAIRTTVRTAPFNDLAFVEKLFRDQGRDIAGILVEPMMGNCFGIMPESGYLEGLRALCDEHGVVLIFDEVKTGFRMAPGGAYDVWGVKPDLGTYAKSMGNGFPIAAIAGRHEVISAWAGGGIMQAGTYSGNSIGAAAAKATIEALLTGEPHRKIEQSGTTLMEGLAKICADRGVPVQITGHWSMFSLFFSDHAPKEFRDTSHHDADLYASVVHGMIERGVMPVDDALEPWFLCAAHDDEDVALSLQAFEEALTEALS